jgi:hypothetical protein
MALLKMPRTTPPLPGFTYTEPSTATRIESIDGLDQLVALVVEHRKYKGIQPQDHEAVSLIVQRQICDQMPPGICQAEAGENYHPYLDISRHLTLDKINAFSHAVFEWIRGGRNLVDEEESQRRAKICLGCPFNKTIPSCSCAPLWSMIKALIPKRRQIDNLHICSLCGCSLSASVLMPIEVLEASDKGRGIEYPPYCWKPMIA